MTRIAHDGLQQVILQMTVRSKTWLRDGNESTCKINNLGKNDSWSVAGDRCVCFVTCVQLIQVRSRVTAVSQMTIPVELRIPFSTSATDRH